MADSDHHQQHEVQRLAPSELLMGSVNAFSQLPFHRPYELLADRRRQSGRQNYVEPIGRGEKEKSVIRIFGAEINGKPQDSDLCTCVGKHGLTLPEISSGHGTEGEKKIRSSECKEYFCRYCCRVFPTCQALGGHQKAHKRERRRVQLRCQREKVATSVYSHVNLLSPPGLSGSSDLDSPDGMRAQAYNNAMTANLSSNLDRCDIWNLNSNRHHRQSSESQLSMDHIQGLKPQSLSSLHMPLCLGKADLQEEDSSAGRLLLKQRQIKQHSSFSCSSIFQGLSAQRKVKRTADLDSSSSSSSIFQGLPAQKEVKRTADLCLDLQLSSCNRMNNCKSQDFPFRNDK